MWRPENYVRHPLRAVRWPDETQAAQSILFSSVEVGGVVLRQRTWVPAMVPWRATEEGEVTDRLLAWYGRLARGRPGGLVVEATGIRDVPSGPLLRIGSDRYVGGLSQLADRVRAASGGETRLFVQLIDFLRVRRRPPAERYFGRFLRVDAGLRERLASALGSEVWLRAPESGVRARLAAGDDALHEAVLEPRALEALRYGERERVTDTHLAHVAALPSQLPDLFAAAARRAERAGFDGVELHYAHAYTMASLLSRSNDRGDGYGGSAEGRLRAPLEVYRAVRSSVSARFVVGCRMLADEVVEGGSRVEDACRYARAFAEAGMDFLSLSKGGRFEDAAQPKVGEAVYPYTGRSGYECMPTVFGDAVGPFGRNLGLARQVREAVRAAGFSTPVVAAGGLNDFEICEGALASGAADIVASARQSLADPDWWRKMREGRGAEVRRCKMTNYCEALDNRHKEVTCQLWDRLDLERAEHLSRDGRRRLEAP